MCDTLSLHDALPICYAGVVNNGVYFWRGNVKAGSVDTADQHVGAPYDITEAGVQSVPAPYANGANFLDTGVANWGAATHGAYAAAGQNWTIQGSFVGFNTGSICAQSAQSVGVNRMFDFRAQSATSVLLIICGYGNNYTCTPLNGLPLNFSIVCTNGVVTININNTGRQSATVGAAAAEAVNFTWFVREEATPTSFYTGFGSPIDIIDRAISTTEESQSLTYIKSVKGGP
jgi:hypothetical protein